MIFTPGHITGFFKICKNNNNPLKTGSIGCGLTINKGVYTKLVNGNGNIYFNNKNIKLCPTLEVINQYNAKFNNNINNNIDNNIDNNISFKYNVIYKSDFPLSSGLGVSGSCALGLSKLLFNKSIEQLKYAHIAEVKCGTGLGDVIGQFTKGITIRKKEGIPLNIEHIKIKDIEKYFVVVDILGKKETKNIITNDYWINKINYNCDKLLNKLIQQPNINNFMKLSYEFAKNTQLANDEILSICNDLNFTVGASQAMLGNTIFCICENKDLNDVISILKNPIICKIYE